MNAWDVKVLCIGDIVLCHHVQSLSHQSCLVVHRVIKFVKDSGISNRRGVVTGKCRRSEGGREWMWCLGGRSDLGPWAQGEFPIQPIITPLSPLSTHLQVVGVGQSPSPHLRHPTQPKGGCGTASPTTP